MVNKKSRYGFTLAELIVTIAIIGVLGVLTLGIIRANAASTEYKIAQAKMMDSVSTALATMQLDNKLSGYENTSDFVNQFKNYFDATELTGDDAAAAKASLSKLPTEVSSLAENATFLKSSNGEVIALSYNKDYKPSSQYAKMAQTDKTTATDSVDFKNEALNAVSGFYDINGLDVGPNAVGKDIQVIEPYAAGTANCQGNLIPSSGGGCVCPITANECISLGKTFNDSACSCEVNCPIGKVFSEEAGECICALTAESCGSDSVFDEESCTCKTSMGSSSKCVDNGGTWDAATGTCTCPLPSNKNSCEYKSNNYAFADKDNLCACTCKTADEIKAQIVKNATGDKDIEAIKTYTLPSNKVDNGCIACAAKLEDITSFNIVKENGLCRPKPLIEKNPLCVKPFCEWEEYNEEDPEKSYYNKCIITDSACSDILNTAHKAYFGYPVRSNDCYRDKDDKCKANVDACAENPTSDECKNSIKDCNYKYDKLKCENPKTDNCRYTVLDANSATSTPHYGCSMAYKQEGLDGTIVNGGLVAKKPAGETVADLNATVDNCRCAVKDGSINVSVPRTTYFHNAYGIWEANQYQAFYTHDLTNFTGAYMDPSKKTTIKNVMILEKYKSWYDPIVFNVDAETSYATPATKDDYVDFKGVDGKTMKTAWIARYEKPIFYFLVNDKNSNDDVDNLGELYSEVGGYVTGLQMLNNDFADYIRNKYELEPKASVDSVHALIEYPALAKKGLKTWADMNSNAKVDVSSGDVFEDIIKLKAEKKAHSEQKGEMKNGGYIQHQPKTDKYEFTEISGTGIFDIYTGYTMLSTVAGIPERSGNSTIAIQSKYSILKPIDSLDEKKYWVKIVPTKDGENPDIKFIDENGNEVKREVIIYQNTEDASLKGVDKLVWKNQFEDIYTNKPIGIYLQVKDQFYELQVRGLTDVIFDKK